MPTDTTVTTDTTPTRVTADFWIDPACPWAWVTSRWMLEVQQVRPVDVRWHVMSLAVLNDGKPDLPDWYDALRPQLWAPVRLIIAAEQQHGGEVVLPLITALGTRFHHDKAPKERATYLAALAEVGLPESLVEATEDPSYDDAVRASHEAGMSQVGNDVGTPVIAVDGVAYFGPIVTPIPRGDAAGRLWDGFRLLGSVEGVFEVKRGRTSTPSFP